MPTPIPSNLCLTTRLATVHEFFFCSPPKEKADLIDGRVYVSPLESFQEQDIRDFVWSTLRTYTECRNIDGHVFGCRVAFMLADDCVIEPDVGYVIPERSHLIGKDRVLGPPDLAVEVISDETRVLDLEVKQRLYAENGVREFLAFDAVLGEVRCAELRRGRYVPSKVANGIFRSSVIPGYWLNLEWLTANPVANVYNCLQQILAG